MKKILFLIIFTMLANLALTAQVVNLDFETPGTSASFTYFDNGDFPDPNTSVIENPEKSGINTSDSVLYFVKGVGGQPWAGAWANPGLPIPLDFTVQNRLVCKIWAEKAGTLQLKLEGGPNGDADNWEKVYDIPATGQWVEMFFDVTLPSDNGDVVAFGKIYNKLVIFADFNIAVTEQTILYLDDFGTATGATAEPEPVTFVFNASTFDGVVNSVSVAGTFNSWNAGANPLTEVSAGSGIYTGTADVFPGIIEYKFVVNGGTWEEELSELDECTVNNGGIINRKASIAGESSLNPVSWNSCYNAGEEVIITINVGIPVDPGPSPDGVWIAGGAKFEAPGGKYKMTDLGGGAYTMTLRRGLGFGSHFTITNGNCPDYSCKEQLEGQDCADADSFNDRLLEAVTQDTVINMCYGDCLGLACMASTPKVLTNAGFEIAPNPANSHITVYFDAPLSINGQVTITNTLGVQVKQQNYSTGTVQMNIDITALPAGMYLVSYFKDGKIGTKMFIKD